MLCQRTTANKPIIGWNLFLACRKKSSFVRSRLIPAEVYYKSIKSCCDKLSGVILDIHRDLTGMSGVLRYVDQQRREMLAKVIENLRKFGELTSQGNIMYANDCLSFLRLQTQETAPFSSDYNRDIDIAIEIVKRGGSTGKIYVNRGLEILRNVAQRDAIPQSEEERAYVNELSAGKDNKFLGHVVDKYLFMYERGQFPLIDRDEYLFGVEKAVFGEMAASEFRNNRNNADYVDMLKQVLGDVVKVVEKDLVRCREECDAIFEENYNKVAAFADEIGYIREIQVFGLRKHVDLSNWGLLDKLTNPNLDLVELLSQYAKKSLSARREVIKGIWRIGSYVCLDAFGLHTSAWLLRNSLETYPLDVYRGNDSRIANLIKSSSVFKQFINDKIYDYKTEGSTSFVRTNKDVLSLSDVRDLYLSLKKTKFNMSARLVGKKWLIDCFAHYDYDYTEIVSYMGSTGVDFGRIFVSAANNYATYSQFIGAITPFKVLVEFTYEFDD